MPTREDRAEATALETARDLLARNREGVLLADDRPAAIKFISDPATGDLIAPVPEEVTEASDLLLFVPEESFDAIQLLIDATGIPESALTDRWCAYHLEQNHPVWARLHADSGKHDQWVFPAEKLMGPNPVAREESALCRLLNADKRALARVARDASGVEVQDPVCVGVNDRGVYIRARFSVILARFDRPATSVQQAREQIDRWLAQSAP